MHPPPDSSLPRHGALRCRSKRRRPGAAPRHRKQRPAQGWHHFLGRGFRRQTRRPGELQVHRHSPRRNDAQKRLGRSGRAEGISRQPVAAECGPDFRREQGAPGAHLEPGLRGTDRHQGAGDARQGRGMEGFLPERASGPSRHRAVGGPGTGARRAPSDQALDLHPGGASVGGLVPEPQRP